MSNMGNFLGQAPTMGGLVGHLESTLAQKSAPSVTARFGNRLPGFSGVTLPGSGMNIRKFPKSIRQRGAHEGDKTRNLIGRPGPRNGGSYF